MERVANGVGRTRTINATTEASKRRVNSVLKRSLDSSPRESGRDRGGCSTKKREERDVQRLRGRSAEERRGRKEGVRERGGVPARKRICQVSAQLSLGGNAMQALPQAAHK